jgi:hypothetical protein
MQERPDIAEKRHKARKAVKVLSQAMQQLLLLPRELSNPQGGGSTTPDLEQEASLMGMDQRAAWAGELEDAAAAGATVSPTRRGGPAEAGLRSLGGAGDAARAATRGLQMHEGLNISMAALRSGAARPVRMEEGDRLEGIVEWRIEDGNGEMLSPR